MTDLASKIEGATLAMMSGNLPKAERLCRELLASNPNASRAHLILGIVAQRTRRLDEAIEHLTRAYALEPSADAASCLAAAHRMSGHTLEAAQYLEQAIRLKPNDAQTRVDLGFLYMEGLALRAAEVHLRKAAELTPSDPNAQFMLAQCLERRGKLEQAGQFARAGLSARPMTLEQLSGFIGAMMKMRTPACAAEGALVAMKMAPDRLRARALPARALMEAQREAEALAILNDPSLEQLAEAEHEDSEALSVLGMVFQSFGRLEEAKKQLLRAVSAPQPVDGAFYTYTHCARTTPEDVWIVQAIEDRLKGGHNDAEALHFALGRAYEDLGEYQKAMQQYDAANPAPIAVAEPDSDSPEYALFTGAFLEDNAGHGCESEMPIFVVGMMRSGTTLAEQILSSHPQIGGAGEQSFWHSNTADLIDYAGGAVRTEYLRDAGERYLSVLSTLAPGNARVVDKMPENYRSLGTIHLALPNAKVIHMRRSPIDTCLSIYATFGSGLEAFDHSKAGLVRMYRRYEEEMAHWRRVLPPSSLLEVEYESLVSDPEPTIRRMIEFVGLEWDEACLHPEANTRGVATPSLWQVRRPIHKGSVERWRRFEPWLGELSELLEKNS